MDPQRMFVDRGLLHHAVTPLWSDKSKAWLAQWFSDNGFARAYGSNASNWSGLINPFTGGRSYSQTHAVGQRVDGTTPDATDAERAMGYRVFYIVKDPMNVITWHAGDWTTNRRSVAVENLGDYRNYPLRDGDMKALADFFRPIDKAASGNMYLLLHQEVIATECPARIREGRDQIVNYINTPPLPPAPEKPSAVSKQRFDPAKKFVVKHDTRLVNIPEDTNYGDTVMKKGHVIEDVVEQINYSNGTSFYRTAYARDVAKKMYGFRSSSLDEVFAPVIEKKEEKRKQTVRYTTDYVYLDDLNEGETKLMVKGVDQITENTYLVTYTNGVKTDEELVKHEIIQQGVTEIIGRGTKTNTAPTPNDSEDAASWLKRLLAWVLEMLRNFKFKK